MQLCLQNYMKGNIKSAMRWLDDSSSGGPLALDDVCDKNGSTVHDYLYLNTHPANQQCRRMLLHLPLTKKNLTL